MRLTAADSALGTLRTVFLVMLVGLVVWIFKFRPGTTGSLAPGRVSLRVGDLRAQGDASRPAVLRLAVSRGRTVILPTVVAVCEPDKILDSSDPALFAGLAASTNSTTSSPPSTACSGVEFFLRLPGDLATHFQLSMTRDNSARLSDAADTLPSGASTANPNGWDTSYASAHGSSKYCHTMALDECSVNRDYTYTRSYKDLDSQAAVAEPPVVLLRDLSQWGKQQGQLVSQNGERQGSLVLEADGSIRSSTNFTMGKARPPQLPSGTLWVPSRQGWSAVSGAVDRTSPAALQFESRIAGSVYELHKNARKFFIEGKVPQGESTAASIQAAEGFLRARTELRYEWVELEVRLKGGSSLTGVLLGVAACTMLLSALGFFLLTVARKGLEQQPQAYMEPLDEVAVFRNVLSRTHIQRQRPQTGPDGPTTLLPNLDLPDIEGAPVTPARLERYERRHGETKLEAMVDAPVVSDAERPDEAAEGQAEQGSGLVASTTQRSPLSRGRMLLLTAQGLASHARATMFGRRAARRGGLGDEDDDEDEDGREDLAGGDVQSGQRRRANSGGGSSSSEDTTIDSKTPLSPSDSTTAKRPSSHVPTAEALQALQQPQASKDTLAEEAEDDRHSTTSSTDSLLCRICQEASPRQELFAPCLCSGTSKYVHRGCLQHWRYSTTNRAHRRACAECKAEYRVVRATEDTTGTDGGSLVGSDTTASTTVDPATDPAVAAALAQQRQRRREARRAARRRQQQLRRRGRLCLRAVLQVAAVILAVVAVFVLFGFAVKACAFVLTGGDSGVQLMPDLYHVYLGFCSMISMVMTTSYLAVFFTGHPLSRARAVLWSLGFGLPFVFGYVAWFFVWLLEVVLWRWEVCYPAGVVAMFLCSQYFLPSLYRPVYDLHAESANSVDDNIRNREQNIIDELRRRAEAVRRRAHGAADDTNGPGTADGDDDDGNSEEAEGEDVERDVAADGPPGAGALPDEPSASPPLPPQPDESNSVSPNDASGEDQLPE